MNDNVFSLLADTISSLEKISNLVADLPAEDQKKIELDKYVAHIAENCIKISEKLAEKNS